MSSQIDTTTRIQVSAPSRLHFGLTSVGTRVGRGGAGLMIATPRTEVTVEPADQLGIAGHCAERVRKTVEKWSAYRDSELAFARADDLPCRITLKSHAPQHAGLGSGTQIALSVTSALNRFFEMPIGDSVDTAEQIGRAKRSRIGSVGFAKGGFLAESDRSGQGRVEAVTLPNEWRVLLVRLNDQSGLAGDAESGAFSRLQQTTSSEHQRLTQIITEKLIPAAKLGDFLSFSKSVYEFGYQSGLLFQSVQGGPYNGEMISQLVQSIRKFGICGTGQSSWGPCVYALCPDETTAEALKAELEPRWSEKASIWVSEVCHRGATITTIME